MEDLKIWASSLSALITDSKGLNLFTEYITTERSEECIQFWKSCNILETVSTRALFESYSYNIYKRFIIDGSSQEINIPHSMKKQILDIFSSHKNDNVKIDEYWYFDARDHILHLMAVGPFVRFLANPNSPYNILKRNIELLE